MVEEKREWYRGVILYRSEAGYERRQINTNYSIKEKNEVQKVYNNCIFCGK